MEQKLTKEALKAFKAYLQREEKSAATVEKYTTAVRSFAAWLDGAPVDREAVNSYKFYLTNQGSAPSTVNATISALNSLFCFLGWNDCQTKFLKVQRQVFRDTKRELTRNEYEKLVLTASQRGQERLALIMEAICATGIRVSEVRYLTVEAARAGYATVRLKGKIRTVLIPRKLCQKLLKYAKQQKTVSGEIFLTRNGKSLSRCQIWAEMKRLCKAAGVEASKVFPHNLRHLFAITFYRVCRDIAKLADVLGHSSIETTRIYLMTSGTEHARQIEQLGLVS